MWYNTDGRTYTIYTYYKHTDVMDGSLRAEINPPTVASFNH